MRATIRSKDIASMKSFPYLSPAPDRTLLHFAIAPSPRTIDTCLEFFLIFMMLEILSKSALEKVAAILHLLMRRFLCPNSSRPHRTMFSDSESLKSFISFVFIPYGYSFQTEFTFALPVAHNS